MIRVCFGAALLLLTAWTAPALAQSGGPGPGETGNVLPPDFHGRISYFGNHSGEVVAVTTFAGGPKKDCPRPDHKCPERIGGSLAVELEFSGDNVNGVFHGTGGLRDSKLIGRRVGAECHLYDETDGSVWDGRCDSQVFRGTVKSVTNAQIQIALTYEALGTRLRDYSEWIRRRKEAIMRKRRYDSLNAQLASDAPLEARYAAAVEVDSYGWPFDRFQQGSIVNVRRTKLKHGAYDLYGEFALDGGASGWARVHFEGGDFACIELWDVPGVCRPLNRVGPPPIPSETPPPDEAPAPAAS